MDLSFEQIVSGLDSPEGPAFDRDGNLFFVNWLTSAIHRLTPDGDLTEFFNTGGIPAGLAFHPDGSLWVADEGNDIHGLLRIDADGNAEILVNEYQGTPLNGANDLVFDSAGNCYFSDPWGSSLDNPIGGFYRYNTDGSLLQIDTGLAFPNGLALVADESAIILAETQRNQLLRYEIAADASVRPSERWSRTRAPSGPDGMAFAADGRLLVAHFGGGTVDVFAPDGAPDGTIAIPGPSVTNVAFGGDDNMDIVVTEVSTGSVYRARFDVPGQPLNDGRS